MTQLLSPAEWKKGRWQHARLGAGGLAKHVRRNLDVSSYNVGASGGMEPERK